MENKTVSQLEAEMAQKQAELKAARASKNPEKVDSLVSQIWSLLMTKIGLKNGK